MGSFNGTCAFSHLGINYGENVECAIILEHINSSKAVCFDDNAELLTFPFVCKYDDAGCVNQIQISEMHLITIKNTKFVTANKQSYIFSSFDQFIQDIAVKNVHAIINIPGKKDCDCPLSLLMYHKDLYDKIIDAEAHIIRTDYIDGKYLHASYEVLVRKAYTSAYFKYRKALELERKLNTKDVYFVKPALDPIIRYTSTFLSGYLANTINEYLVETKNIDLLDEYNELAIELALFSRSFCDMKSSLCGMYEGDQEDNAYLQIIIARFIIEYCRKRKTTKKKNKQMK